MLMSQVRKYREAGTLPAQPATKKVGKFTMNGRSIEGQLALDRLLTQASAQPGDERGMYSVAQKAIQDGNEAIYDPTNNTIQVLDSEGNNITNDYLDDKIKAKPTDSNFRRNWGATFNTLNHRFKKSGLSMGSIDMNTPEEEKPDTKIELRRGNGWFNYKTIKDGKKDKSVYDENDILNKDYMDIIHSILGYATDAEDVDTKYKYSAWKDAADREQLRQLANELNSSEGGVEGYFERLKSRIISNKLSDGDIRILNLMGFNKDIPAVTSNDETSSSSSESESPYTEEWTGNQDAAKRIGISGITQDKDGSWKISGDDYNNAVWYLGGLDAFDNTAYKGGFAINGKLYTADQVYNDRDLDPYVGGFMGARGSSDWNDWYNKANASGVRFLDDRIWAKKYYNAEDDYNGAFKNYDYRSEYNPDFYDFFKTQGIINAGVRDESGAFDDIGDIKVLQYVDPSKRDRFGIMIPQYVAKTADGYTQVYNDLSELGKAINKNIARYKSSGKPKFEFDVWDSNGMAQHASFMTSDGTQTNTLARDRAGNYYLFKGPDAKPIKVDPSNIAGLMAVIKGQADIDNKTLSRINKPNLFTTKKEEGGTIDKFQYGGTTTGQTAVEKVEKDLSKAKHDITNSHIVMHGNDGGLTPAEKLQLIGALGDLAGVGVSFIPAVGNITGAATGAAASTTKFIGDIKQDGFQGKDLGNYLLNLGLDATTLLIPAVGKTAKGAKALKTIKGLAEPIMMALAVGGATTAAGVMKKIIAGEKVTSKDMTQLIQGLSTTVLGGSTAIKVGKEAKTLAKESAANLNQALDTTKSTKIGDKTITKSNKQLQDLIGNYKTKTAIAEQLGKEIGTTLTDAQVTKALEDLGLVTKGRSLTHPFRKERLKLATKLPSSKSGFRYFNDPFARNKGLNLFAGTITKEELKAANNAIKTGDFTNISKAKAQTIARLAAERPYAFSNGMFQVHGGHYGSSTGETDITKLNRWTLGGHRVLRSPSSYVTPMVEIHETGPSRILTAPYIKPYKPPTTEVTGMESDGQLLFKNGGLISKMQEGGPVGTAWKFKLSPILDLGSTLIQNAAIGRAYDKQREANAEMMKRQFITPQLVQQRFDTSPIEHKYNLAEEPLRKFKFVSSDPTVNLASKLAVTEKLLGLGMQKGAEISDYINQHNAQEVATMNQQRQLDAQTANEKSQYYTNLDARNKQLNAAELNEKWANVWNTYSQQFRQGIRDAENKIIDADYQMDVDNLTDRYNLTKKNLLKDLYAQYDADTNVNKGTFDNWITQNNERYTTYNNIINSDGWKNAYNQYRAAMTDLNKKYARLSTFKTGGKIRSVSEELTIQSNKAAKKAVQRMNSDLMKMLLQLMK